MATATEPVLVHVGHAFAHPDPPERIAQAHGDSDESTDCLGQAVHLRGAARQDDLPDAECTGLRLVELQRSDQLARRMLANPRSTAPRALADCSGVSPSTSV